MHSLGHQLVAVLILTLAPAFESAARPLTPSDANRTVATEPSNKASDAVLVANHRRVLWASAAGYPQKGVPGAPPAAFDVPVAKMMAPRQPKRPSSRLREKIAAEQQIIDNIDQQLGVEEAKGFGGAIIIKRGNTVLLSRGYGYANREAKVRFSPSTIAQIASVTKSQTAAVIATLIADGKVALQDRVSRFIPEAPEPGRSRTIAQLLTHMSGLAGICTEDFERQSESMLIHTCLSRPLAFPVGEDNYSNVGYSVLGLIIERVTQQSWEAAVRERVWKPFGMKDIGVRFPGRSDRSFARGYKDNRAQPVLSRSIAALKGDDWALRGNGSLQASATTMIHFLDGMLDQHSRFPEAARRLMLAPVPGQTGKVQEGFGLVFRYDDAGKLVRIGHSGSDGVFFTYLCWLPGNDVRFYLVGNNGEENVQRALAIALTGAMKLPDAEDLL